MCLNESSNLIGTYDCLLQEPKTSLRKFSRTFHESYHSKHQRNLKCASTVCIIIILKFQKTADEITNNVNNPLHNQFLLE